MQSLDFIFYKGKTRSKMSWKSLIIEMNKGVENTCEGVFPVMLKNAWKMNRFMAIIQQFCQNLKNNPLTVQIKNKMSNFQFENVIDWLDWATALYKKWSFPLRVSSVNVIKSAVSCGFGSY